MATFTGYPASYNETYSVHGGDYNGYPSSNAIGKASSNGSYSQWYLSEGANAETYIYYNFDLSEIPQNATIDSVSCTTKSYVSQTNANRISVRQIQLRNGKMNPVGNPSTISTSASVLTLDCGTWTRDMLNDCGICIYVQRGTSSTTSNYYTRLYGATLTIEYTLGSSSFTFTASCNNGGSIAPTSGTVTQGGSIDLELEANEGYRLQSLTSNGNPVQFTETVVQGLIDGITLLHLDNGFSDVLQNSNITNNGATIDASVSKFGGSSLYFDQNSYLKIDVGQTAYTLEFWFYRLGSNTSGWYPTIFSTAAANDSGGTYVHLDDGGYGRYPVYRSNSRSNTSNNGGYGDMNINSGQWYHFAYCRDGSNHRFYLDGVLQYTVSQSNPADTDIFYLGCLFSTSSAMSGCYFNGYIDEVLISSSVKYDASFTPPTSSFVATEKVTYHATISNVQENL